jgi:hypothetical protein
MSAPQHLWSTTMLKIRLLAIAAAFGLVSLVGCGPVPSSDKLKDAGDKIKEGAGKVGDKIEEGTKKAGEAVKDGWEKMKDTVGKWKEGYDKDYAALDAKVKELDAKKAAAKTPEEIKKAETEFKEANGMLETIKASFVGGFEKIKDGTAWEDFKKNIEPKIAELKKKLGIM